MSDFIVFEGIRQWFKNKQRQKNKNEAWGDVSVGEAFGVQGQGPELGCLEPHTHTHTHLCAHTHAPPNTHPNMHICTHIHTHTHAKKGRE